MVDLAVNRAVGCGLGAQSADRRLAADDLDVLVVRKLPVDLVSHCCELGLQGGDERCGVDRKAGLRGIAATSR